MITTRFDAAEYLKTKEDIVAFLEDAFESGNEREILHALGVVARAKRMTQIAKDTDLGRTSLYKALRDDGHPEFETILKVVRALGLRLVLKPIDRIDCVVS